MKKLNFLVLLVSVCFFASAQQSANTWITGGIHHRLPNIDYRFEAHPCIGRLLSTGKKTNRNKQN
jgi:hypothetical protein